MEASDNKSQYIYRIRLHILDYSLEIVQTA